MDKRLEKQLEAVKNLDEELIKVARVAQELYDDAAFEGDYYIVDAEMMSELKTALDDWKKAAFGPNLS